MGYSPLGHKESDATVRLTLAVFIIVSTILNIFKCFSLQRYLLSVY